MSSTASTYISKESRAGNILTELEQSLEKLTNFRERRDIDARKDGRYDLFPSESARAEAAQKQVDAIEAEIASRKKNSDDGTTIPPLPPADWFPPCPPESTAPEPVEFDELQKSIGQVLSHARDITLPTSLKIRRRPGKESNKDHDASVTAYYLERFSNKVDLSAAIELCHSRRREDGAKILETIQGLTKDLNDFINEEGKYDLNSVQAKRSAMLEAWTKEVSVREAFAEMFDTISHKTQQFPITNPKTWHEKSISTVRSLCEGNLKGDDVEGLMALVENASAGEDSRWAALRKLSSRFSKPHTIMDQSSRDLTAYPESKNRTQFNEYLVKFNEDLEELSAFSKANLQGDMESIVDDYITTVTEGLNPLIKMRVDWDALDTFDAESAQQSGE